MWQSYFLILKRLKTMLRAFFMTNTFTSNTKLRFFFSIKMIYTFPNNIYNIKTIKIKETFLKSVNHKYNQNQNVF